MAQIEEQAAAAMAQALGGTGTVYMCPVNGTRDRPYLGPTKSSLNAKGNASLTWDNIADFGVMPLRAGESGAMPEDGEAQLRSSLNPYLDQRQGNGERILVNPNNFHGQSNAFGVAMFPVVYRLSASGMSVGGQANQYQTSATVVPFAVVASSEPWGNLASEAVTAYRSEPDYRAIRSPTENVTIHLDVSFLGAGPGAESSILAAISSVSALLPGRWNGVNQCYLTIAPCCDAESGRAHMQRVAAVTQQQPDNSFFRFGGASLGLAIAAAVYGMPTMAYTGYLSSVGLNQVMSRDAERGFGEVMLGANMVETVDDIDLKTFWALTTGTLLCLPISANNRNMLFDKAIERATAASLVIGGKNTQARDTLLGKLARAVTGSNNAVDYTRWAAVNMPNYVNTIKTAIYTAQKLSRNMLFLEAGTYLLGAVNFSDVERLTCAAGGQLFGVQGMTYAMEVAGKRRKLIDDVEPMVRARIVKKRASAAASKAKKAAAGKKPPKTAAQKAAKKEKRSVLAKKKTKGTTKATTKATTTKKKAAEDAAAPSGLMVGAEEFIPDVVFVPDAQVGAPAALAAREEEMAELMAQQEQSPQAPHKQRPEVKTMMTKKKAKKQKEKELAASAAMVAEKERRERLQREMEERAMELADQELQGTTTGLRRVGRVAKNRFFRSNPATLEGARNAYAAAGPTAWQMYSGNRMGDESRARAAQRALAAENMQGGASGLGEAIKGGIDLVEGLGQIVGI